MIPSFQRVCCLAALTVGMALLAGCSEPAPPVVETPPPVVTISQVVVREIITYDDFEGSIKAKPVVEVRARVRGHLIKINFQDGDMVKEGTLLYEIDPRPYQAGLDAAKAQEAGADASLELAKKEYDRTLSLTRKGAASREELDVWTAKQATAAAEKLKALASVEQAKLDLDYTKISAPISGRIGRSQIDVGNLVNAGGGETLLTTIVALNPIYVYFTVDERTLARYRREDTRDMKKKEEDPPSIKDFKIPVFVGLEGENGYPHKGIIDFTDNRINPNTGTLLARGELSNKDRQFGDGMRARVRIPGSDPFKALLVTERAIGNEQGRKFVYVVNDKNTVERRDVVLGRLADGLQVVNEGLKPGEWVVVNGIQRVRAGIKVEPQRVPMPGAQPQAATTEKTDK